MKKQERKLMKDAVRAIKAFVIKNEQEVDRLEAEYDDKWKTRYEPSQVEDPKLPFPK